MEAGDIPHYLLEKFTKERKTGTAWSDTRAKKKLGQRETKGKCVRTPLTETKEITAGF